MKKILVTGASGQIGSELIPELRKLNGDENVIASVNKTPMTEEVQNSGPNTKIDVRNIDEIDSVIKKYKIDTIFHLGSILSASAETNRKLAYQVNFNGLNNILESSVTNSVKKVMLVSSIAAFGPETPSDNTPNDTIQKPNTHYGISKVFTELLGNYFATKLNLDVRGVRLPGIISWKVEPTAGTTDYAVAIFYDAIMKESYTCPLEENTKLPMMYMPDAISSLIMLEKADKFKLKHFSDFNVNSMSFTPKELSIAIKKKLPRFEINYQINPMLQSIADSWPDKLDDSVARTEWGWNPEYDLDSMVEDMIINLSKKFGIPIE